MKRCSTPMCGETGVCSECRPRVVGGVAADLCPGPSDLIGDARTVLPGRPVMYHDVPKSRAASTIPNPDHESLVARFDQLERNLKAAAVEVDACVSAQLLHTIYAKSIERYLRDAIKLATLIREQVVA